jgi:four helix bundle protein
MLDAGCWMLDAGCWMLDAGCWMLDAGCWMLENCGGVHVLLEIIKKYFMSYKNLEIWTLAKELSIEIHKVTMMLPKFEQFEEAQQIRRSIKTVRSTIVEGYGRRYYKAEFIKFIIYALASNDETIDHLEMLYETGSLTNKDTFDALHQKLEVLGRKINSFLQSIQQSHQQPGGHLHEPFGEYQALNDYAIPASNIQYLASST